MSNKEEHIRLIRVKGDFTVDCSHQIFSTEELETLRKFGHWFEALETGELKPITERQFRFVDITQGKEMPFSLEEKAWFKYKGRKKIEKENPESLKIEYRIVNEFFSREDYYKMHPGKKRKI